jgi:hypothetical protein
MRILTAIVIITLTFIAGASTSEQDCLECLPLAERLGALERELAEAQARVGELRQQLSTLKASKTVAALQELPKVQAQFDDAVKRVMTLQGMVMTQTALLRQCQLECRRKKDRPPRQGDPIDETIPRAACKLCEPVLERIKDLQRLRRIARDELKDSEQRLNEHEERGKTAADERWFGEGIQLTFEKIAATQQLDELNDLIAGAIDELTACNLRCTGKAPPPKTVTTGNTPGTTAPEKFTMCRPCQETALALSKAEKELAQAESQVEQRGINEAAAAFRNEQNRAALRDLELKGQGGSLDAELLRTQINGFDALKDFGDPDGDGVTRFEEQLRDRVEKARKQVGDLKQKLESCEQGCKTKQTSQIFHGPVPYAIAGGVGTVALLASGSSTPIMVANTPVAPQQPPATIAQPVQPAPQTRRPAGTLSVTSCTCTTNTAAFDGVLQGCERIRQIRTQGTGNTIAISGDSPLPTFQGTFSESSGEFSLTATVTIGNTVSNAVIAGTVELSGNIHNLRLSFGASGRQTVYELSTTPVP